MERLSLFLAYELRVVACNQYKVSPEIFSKNACEFCKKISQEHES